MSIPSIEQTNDPFPMGAIVATPLQAANAIVNGYIPNNLVHYSNMSDSFRDATLADILSIAAANNKFEQVLDTLSAAVRGSSNDSINLRVYSEYMAAIAFAWEHQELAARVIMRNSPQNASPFLWSIVSAIKKNMPSAMYASLLLSFGEQASQKWEEHDSINIFGLSPQNANVGAASLAPTI